MYCLVPRRGSIDSIMLRDAQLMVHLIRGNLGSLIFEQMQRCVAHEDKALPYAHIVMALLKSKGEDVSPVNEDDKWRTDLFGQFTIKNMSYVREDGEWILKKSKAQDQKKRSMTRSQSQGKFSKGKETVVEKGPAPKRQRTSTRKKSSPAATEDSSSVHRTSVLHRVLSGEIKHLKYVLGEKADKLSQELTTVKGDFEVVKDLVTKCNLSCECASLD